jgi:SAM-dependent methyltransferase
MSDYETKLQEQIMQFQDGIDPLPLTDSFHHWSHSFVRPKVLAEFVTESIVDFYAIPFAETCRRKSTATFASLGSGDASVEIAIAKALISCGITNFRFIGLELSPLLVATSNQRIIAADLSEHLTTRVFDLNYDQLDETVDGFMANQSLHHFLDLEKAFAVISRQMAPDGCFLANDMIGRNGHMRWPEVLQFVNAVWEKLPPEKKYNHQTREQWSNFINFHCSNEGFEGVRAQDILPLLNEHFRFTHFVGAGGVIDPFIDRGFCRNYDPSDPGDRLFIDTLEAFNSTLLDFGIVKPTIMFARMIHKDGSPQHPLVLKSIRTPGHPSAVRLARPERSCPICGETPIAQIAALKNTFPGPIGRGTFDLLQCEVCNIVYQSPLPTPDDFKLMYEEAAQFTSPEYRDPKKIEGILSYYTSCVRQMIELMGTPRNLHVLEIGAGLAWICRSTKLVDPLAVTVAQDVSSECKDECSAFADSYIIGTMDDPTIERNGPYDIISMTHVIEHLPNPAEALKRLKALLKPGGCIFVTCPHRPEGWEDNPSQESWASWSYNHVPGHLQYFSKDAMAKAATRADLYLSHWTLHENGQAIEAILRPSGRI